MDPDPDQSLSFRGCLSPPFILILILGSFRRRISVLRAAASGHGVSAGASRFLPPTNHSSSYAAAMYSAWQADPRSVDVHWARLFEKSGASSVSTAGASSSASTTTAATSSPAAVSDKDVLDNLAVWDLIRAYRVRGHNIADLDPLGLSHIDLDATTPLEARWSDGRVRR